MLAAYGRRPMLALGFGVGGLSCILCLVLPAGLPVTAAAMVGKFFVTAAFGSIFVYAAELFPTVLRSAAIGLCSTSARVGGATAPLVVSLVAVAPWMPLAVFGGAVSGGVPAHLPPKRRPCSTVPYSPAVPCRSVPAFGRRQPFRHLPSRHPWAHAVRGAVTLSDHRLGRG